MQQMFDGRNDVLFRLWQVSDLDGSRFLNGDGEGMSTCLALGRAVSLAAFSLFAFLATRAAAWAPPMLTTGA